QSCPLDRLNHRYLCVATADFFNEIGPSEKRDVDAQAKAAHDGIIQPELKSCRHRSRVRSQLRR
ncbi:MULTISPECIES: hypothetical protein, partial [unclassified Bradyrhizobium]